MFSKRSGVLTMLCGVATFVLALLASKPAYAYPWMIKHHYVACRACHADPSGSGPITPYARAVSDEVMTMGGAGQGDERFARFLFGAVPTPAWLELGADARVMTLSSKSKGAPLVNRLIWMQLDGYATINVDRFVASGTLGYAPEGALGAALTRSTEGNLVSRQHWVGYRLPFGDDFMLRAGRMNLPFGIRTIEHTLWARRLTRTNINDEQQYGVSAYFAKGPVRGEVMGILGNFQLRPDRYRERGYSAYVEAEVKERLALGVSSLVTHRDLDTVTLEETWRQVHGAFARWAPFEPLALLTEWDYLFESSRNSFHRRGLVSYLQADWEPVQGIHFLATGELNNIGLREREWSYGGWLSYAWFFAPRCDIRLDGIYQSLGAAGTRSGVYTLLLQGHVFL